MRKVGLVCAVEMNAVFDKFGAPSSKDICRGYEVLVYERTDYTLFVVKSMMGEVYASATTQFLITKYDVDIIVNFGVVGGLTQEMSRTKLCIVQNAVHYAMDTSQIDGIEVGRYLNYDSIFLPATLEYVDVAKCLYPELKVVNCASADKFVADGEEKKRIGKNFDCQICDMESAGIILVANRNSIPVLLIKCVADSLMGGSEEYTTAFSHSSSLALDILDGIITAIIRQ